MSANPAVQFNPFPGADEQGAEQGGLLIRSISFPVVLRPSHPLSDDELLEFCVDNDFFRIERSAAGELIVMTPSGGKTSNCESFLSRELDLWAEKDGRGIAFNANGGFSLPDGSVRAADAAWLLLEKWNRLSREQQAKFVPFCPDFLIELRSPSDPVGDLESKMADWMSNGAQLGWLIDPQRKVAILYRPGRNPETLVRPETLHGEAPVAGFELKMHRFWE